MNLPSKQRLMSVDVFRGWAVAAMLVVNNAGDWNQVYRLLEHSEWNGCTAADYIFPFFLFLLGAGLGLSEKSGISEAERMKQLRAACWRSFRLFALGLALHLVATLTIDGRAFRIPGVLQRIGLCFLLASSWQFCIRSFRWRWYSIAALGVVYTLILASGVSLAPDVNLADRLDSLLLGHFAMDYDSRSGVGSDPEGVLSTLGALINVQVGVMAAAMLRQGQRRQLLLCGSLLMLTGFIASTWLPLNKHLWTASFAAWTSGAACSVLLLLHQLNDRLGMPPVGRSLGVNAIVVYAGSWLAECGLAWSGWGELIYRQVFVALLTPAFNAQFASAMFACTLTLIFAGVAVFMNWRGWRIVI